MKMKKQRAFSLFGIFTVMMAFLLSPIPTFAASVNYTKVADYVSTWHIQSLGGLHWTDDGVHMIRADNTPAFCIEHGTFLNGGSGYTPSELSVSQKERLSLIAYYGYQVAPTVENYGITQTMIWQELGDELLTTALPNYNNRKTEILNQVNQHHTKPSFHNQTIELKVGESITLTDSKGVLTKYAHLLSNSANLAIEKTGNTLKLTATKSSKESGTLSYGIASNDRVGQSFVYTKAGEQKVATFKLATAGEMNLNIKVNLNGNVKVKKVDEETRNPVPNTKLKFEYNGQIKEITTDNNGLAQLNDLQAGTKIKITEVTAANGYVNKGESREITIEPNKTIEVTFGNKAQQGLLKLKKTGKQATSLQTEETDYGLLHKVIFDYLPLANVTFTIKATEDIKVGETIHAKKGETVATVSTNEKGELINMPRLYLGKYEAIETKAPTGFLVDSTPLPFEFTYGGQEVELVSHSLEAKNDFQQVSLVIHKNEETITDWQENEPIIEAIPANDQVFGLFTNQEVTLADGSVVPTNALLSVDTVKDGTLTFASLHLPQGSYYVKELAAGERHDLDTTRYEFDYQASDHEQEITIDIYGHSSTDGLEEEAKETEKEATMPILNQLHFNEFTLKKINEEATLQPKKGYDFAFTGNGKGAVFTLENDEQTVIQTVMVNDQSLATFKQIPVGTFYLKEKQTSSEKYVLSKETYKIVSTLAGIQVYDSQDKLMASTIEEQKDEEQIEVEEKESTDSIEETENQEPAILFELTNALVKGSVELTKTDVSTGKSLPNTSIQILDKDKKVVVEGKTDANGVFHFDELPAGSYYFKEFDAPTGYQLDETLLPFEIKKEGEIVKCNMTNQLLPVNETETPTSLSSLPQTGEQKAGLGKLIGVVLIIGVASYAIYRKKKQTKAKQEK